MGLNTRELGLGVANEARTSPQPMKIENLKRPTEELAPSVVELLGTQKVGRTCDLPGGQFLSPRTCVGANCQAARRARSTADFISKMGTVEKEANEAEDWMELLIDAGRVNFIRAESRMREADAWIAISSISTAWRNQKPSADPALHTPHLALQ